MSNKVARLGGIAVQAAVLGYLLFIAVMRMVAVESGATVFRYQGF
jgi:hypothetical protein